jgi:hypothetical protein
MDSAPTRLILAKAPDLRKPESNAEWNSITQQYMALTHSDPDNVQPWSACTNALFIVATWLKQPQIQ